MLYGTLFSKNSFETALHYSNIGNNLIGLNLKGKPRIVADLIFEANFQNDYKGNAIDAIIFKFNENGNLIGYCSKYESSFYSYNQEGCLEGLLSYSGNGRLQHNVKFFTSNGRLIECIDFDQNDIQIAKYNFFYDSNHNLIESLIFEKDTDVLFAKFEYSYKSDHKCASQRITYTSELRHNNHYQVFEYDQLGNLISILPYPTDYQYFDFDELGNWRTRNCNTYSDADNITNRTIIYR